MILVTGGAYSGKSEFIKKKFAVDDKDFFDFTIGNSFDFDKLGKCKVISNFEKYIEVILKNEYDLNEKILEFLNSIKTTGVIIEIRQMGSGIVPIDEFERRYREAVGRVSCKLAENSDEVYRVVCGLGMKIK